MHRAIPPQAMVVILGDVCLLISAGCDGRDADQFGRMLRLVTVDGRSVGETLISEGLAQPWEGRRHYPSLRAYLRRSATKLTRINSDAE